MLAIISLLKLARLFERLRYSLLTAIYDRMPGEVERFKGRALFRLNVSMGTNRTALHDLLHSTGEGRLDHNGEKVEKRALMHHEFEWRLDAIPTLFIRIVAHLT
jgi:hypothetical protein